jgi:hypothetical protein
MRFCPRDAHGLSAHETISGVNDAVVVEVEVWRCRPLEET